MHEPPLLQEFNLHLSIAETMLLKFNSLIHLILINKNSSLAVVHVHTYKNTEIGCNNNEIMNQYTKPVSQFIPANAGRHLHS